MGSRIVRDFNENMTWINTVFGSVIGCVTKSSSKTSCRPTELAVRPTAAAALSEGAQRQCRCVQRRSIQRRSAQRRSEGAFSQGAQRRSAQRSAKERNEGALSAGTKERSAKEGIINAQRRSIWRRAVGRQEGLQFLHAGSRGWSHDQGGVEK